MANRIANASLVAVAVLGLSIAALGGAGAFRDWRSRVVCEVRPPDEDRMVVVAATDLMPGVPIESDDVVGVVMPREYVPEDALSHPELVIGQVPHERILANEVVRPGRLADAAASVGLAALVPRGEVAMSLQQPAPLLAHVRPGDQVDVMVTVGGEEGLETVTLGQRLRVLAVSRAGVTLAVRPERAEQLHEAERLGRIALALYERPGPFVPVPEDGVSDDELFDVIRPVEPVPRVIRGVERR